MNKFWIITKEVYKKNVKSFGFLIMVLSPLIVAGIAIAIGYFTSQEAENAEAPTIAVISESPGIQEVLSQEGSPFDVQADITTQEEAEEALVDESLDGYLTVDESAGSIQARLSHTDSLTDYVPLLNEQLATYQAMLRAGELGLSQEEVMSLSEPVEVEESIITVEDGILTTEENNDTFVQEFGAYFVCIGIFIFIMTYASIIAEEVANEKGTRIMEVILSSATAGNHFFGKLAGVILVILTQIAVYVVVGVVGYFFAKDIAFVQEIIRSIDIWDVIQQLLGYTIIFFITGVLMYVILAAFFGSLASKMEDVNKAVTPIVMIALAGFYVGMFAFISPDNILPVIFSYIPLFTPFVMPFRIASETVGTVEIWISIVGTVAFTVLLTAVSLAFYRANVLIYSDSGIIGTMKRSYTVMKSNRKAKKMNKA
ncbi:ABC transporter permease [Marinilactibacillus sp. Marseille-P9653]|uniref:ABC transporter permease n=1 Tax=Marinilactibacillus sp. Marseille-P9653 TaxID=2866583 RepID=UPI001CE3E3A1|nr:ABC transporter permease [Marinilactibacillus sp. Marseille-P9653]